MKSKMMILTPDIKTENTTHPNFIDEYNNVITLEDIKYIITGGMNVKIITTNDESRFITCHLKKDIFYDDMIPYVSESRHERFVTGTRFDYGFMYCAIQDGFNIEYNY